MAFEMKIDRISMAKRTSMGRLAIRGLLATLIAVAAPVAAIAGDDERATSSAVVQNAAAPAPTFHVRQVQTAQASREYLIKAAILFNFAKFASWPEDAFGYPGAPLRICVLGNDPFGPALDSLQGKQVHGRPLATMRIAQIEESPQCHILFVSESEKGSLERILDYVAKRPILTVADITRFANSGGIIALKEDKNRSRIEVNLGAAAQAGVKLSSKLLRLAETVSTQAAQGQVD